LEIFVFELKVVVRKIEREEGRELTFVQVCLIVVAMAILAGWLIVSDQSNCSVLTEMLAWGGAMQRMNVEGKESA